jgi:hypothetical protein
LPRSIHGTDASALRFARWVSLFCNPLIIGVPVVLAIGIKEHGGFRPEHVVPALECIAVLCLVPLVYTLVLVRKGIIQDFHVTDRKQRIYLFPVLLACFALGGWILYHTGGMSRLILALLGFGLVNCLLCALISMRFKISLHCAGLASLAVGVYYSFGPYSLLPSLGILVITAWSRLRLKEHTSPEVVAGSLFGIIVTGAELYVTIGAP